MPAGTVYVGRPSCFGNPFKAGETTPADWHQPFAGITVTDRAHAVDLLRSYLHWRSQKPSGWCSPIGPHFPGERQIRRMLRGRDLACWCPIPAPGQPDHCHAAVLLHIANGGSQ